MPSEEDILSLCFEAKPTCVANSADKVANVKEQDAQDTRTTFSCSPADVLGAWSSKLVSFLLY